MSIEKFLNNVENNDNQPGPFKARLKHNLKQDFVKRRSLWNPISVTATSFASVLLILVITIIIKPTLAQDMNYAITKTDSNIVIEKTPNHVEKLTSLSNLDEEKPYIIRKITKSQKEQFTIKEMNIQPMISSAF